ncbi:sodium:proton antiporter NhaD [Flavobacteriaceae bacterium]|nr:sodium:proton antiporter NhaD [Flavobacteriaceae bacterium]MDC1060949.1 sodium:proton antiporter NhaD [Flavobacteriaceae bacterium]
MELLLIAIFVLGYLAITLEHTLKVDKLIPALAMMAILWAIIALAHLPVFDVDTALKQLVPSHIDEILLHHLGKTAEIIIFLLGAMTIVEIIDYFNGFAAIKAFIKTKSKKSLLWIFAILAFVLSAIIDNLTATIVLITILQKVILDRDTRLWFAGLIIVSANAGGAWSPIGDVTTTMLWIGNKVTTGKLIAYLLLPSIVCVVVPVFVASLLPAFKGDIPAIENQEEDPIHPKGAIMLYLGLSAIVFVPVFKTVTHLPPYVGMMFSLAIVATFAEIFSATKISITSIDQDHDDASHNSPVHKSLSKIELPSILFFLGILLAVAALESLGMLFGFADSLNTAIPNTDIVIMLLGIGSAVIDNVPLVAASMGMFSQGVDDPLWHFIAFSAGTGGSMLIIGSAAGVVAMGMEKIDFFWYLKKISWLAFIGFLAGSITFMLLRGYIA